MYNIFKELKIGGASSKAAKKTTRPKIPDDIEGVVKHLEDDAAIGAITEEGVDMEFTVETFGGDLEARATAVMDILTMEHAAMCTKVKLKVAKM